MPETVMDTDHIEWVDCAGGRAGTAELTWGQRYIWQIIQHLSPHDEHLNMTFDIEVPHGRTMADVRRAVQAALARFETLRTCYPTDDTNEPAQVLAADVRVGLRVRETDAARFLSELRAGRFDIRQGVPARFGVVTEHGVPRRLLIVVSHMVTDGLGAAVLEAFLRDTLRSPETAAGGPTWQPLDQVAVERAPAGQSVAARSLRYWAGQLADAPLVTPGSAPFPPAQPRYWHGRLSSPAVTESARVLADRLRVSANSVLLAAFGALLGQVTGEPRPLLVARVSNRFTGPAQESVGHLSQATVLRFDLGTDSFASFVRATNRAALAAYQFGRYLPPRLDELVARVNEERGGQVDLRTTVNCTRVSTPLGAPQAVSRDHLDGLRRASTFDWIDKRATEDVTMFCYLDPGDILSALVDTAFLPPARITAFLYGIEDLLVRAATGQDQLPALLAGSAVGVND